MKKIIPIILSLILIACPRKTGPDPVRTAIANKLPTLVEFGAGNCVACVKMKPIIHELQTELQEKANVLLIDVNELRHLTPNYGIMLIPTQVFFDTKGTEIYRHVGFFPKDSIIVFLNKAGLKQ